MAGIEDLVEVLQEISSKLDGLDRIEDKLDQVVSALGDLKFEVEGLRGVGDLTADLHDVVQALGAIESAIDLK